MKNLSLRKIKTFFIKVQSFFNPWAYDYKSRAQEKSFTSILPKVEEIEKSMKKDYFKYKLYPLLALYFIFLLFLEPWRILQFTFEQLINKETAFSICLLLLGTLFLSKGFIKSKYQIACESATCLGYNELVIRDKFRTRYDTEIGIFLIFLGSMLQLLFYLS